MICSKYKNKLVVISLKGNAINDPVDRLRGLYVYNKLKDRGWNVELFDEQRDIDLLLSLDYDFKSFCRIKQFSPKITILDLQDDHLTQNRDALKLVPVSRYDKLRRAKKILFGEGLLSVIAIYIYKKLSKFALRNLIYSADYIITSSYSLCNKIKNTTGNLNIKAIPDSIEANSFVERDDCRDKSIVWVGTPGNIKYLLLVNDALESIQKNTFVKIKIITSRQIYLEPTFLDILNKFKFSFDFVEWREKTVISELAKCYIGIAPLPIGIAKSTNKILTYMSAGLIVVCSGSEDYKELNNTYPSSFFYEDKPLEWINIILNLLNDANLYQQYKNNSLLLCKKFTTDILIEQYEDVIYSAFNDAEL